jgi:hypothetical protein
MIARKGLTQQIFTKRLDRRFSCQKLRYLPVFGGRYRTFLQGCCRYPMVHGTLQFGALLLKKGMVLSNR